MNNVECAVRGCTKTAKRRQWCNAHYRRFLRHGHPEALGSRKGKIQRLVEFAINSNTDQCIEPDGYTSKRYPRTKDPKTGHIAPASRIVLTATQGPPPKDNMVAAHSPGVCHNPQCINPRHLRWATEGENAMDRLTDGTHNRGEDNAAAKLLVCNVIEIRRSSDPQKYLADRYGVSQSLISKIRNGDAWGWL